MQAYLMFSQTNTIYLTHHLRNVLTLILLSVYLFLFLIQLKLELLRNFQLQMNEKHSI